MLWYIYPLFFQYEPPEAQLLTVQTEERHGLHVPKTHGQAGLLHHQPPHRHGQIPGADIHWDRYSVNINIVLQVESFENKPCIYLACPVNHSWNCINVAFFNHMLVSEKFLGMWRSMEQTAVTCSQVQFSAFLHVNLCVCVCTLKIPHVGVQVRVSELEEEMMQLQPDIVDVQRQPWRSGEALDTL